MTAVENSFGVRIADLVRLLGCRSEGEVLSAHGALKRLLASRGVNFTDLGNAIEKLETGGLEEAEMRRLFDDGYQKCLQDLARRQAEEFGEPSHSTASARRDASRRTGSANSSTTWHPSLRGAASRRRGRRDICCRYFASSAGGSNDRCS
jgi:hypothetical protein